MTRSMTILLAVGFAAVLATVLFCHPGPNRQEGPSDALQARIGYTLVEIASRGFVAVRETGKAALTWFHDAVPEADPETVSQVIHSTGTWTAPTPIAAGDTLPVEVSAVEVIDGSRWMRLTIGGKPADLDVTEWWAAETPQIVRRWTAHVEAAPVSDRVQIGVGIGYRVCEAWGIGVSPAVTVGVSGEWVAGEVRLTRRVWSGVSIGGGFGARLHLWRLWDPVETHLSAGVSVEL